MSISDAFEYDVFLSFAKADESLVRPVWKHLCASGLRVFWSDASLQERLGESWFEAIEQSLERSRHFLVVCTPASVASEWVKREYRAFQSHCFRPGSRRLLPLLAAGCRPADLPLFLRELEAYALDDPASLQALARLLGGNELESLRARLSEQEEENRALLAEVHRLSEELERFKGLASAGPVQHASLAPDPVPESQLAATLPVKPHDGRSEDFCPDVPKADVVASVRAWLDEVKVNRGFGWDDQSAIIDKNSADVFAILEWALPGTTREEVVVALRSLLVDPDELTRWKAMRLLVYHRFSDATALRKFWADEAIETSRALVVEALDALPTPDALALLIDIARRDASPQLRQAALKALPQYAPTGENHAVVTTLMDALTDEDEGVRVHSLRTLTELKASAPIEAASRMAFKDPSRSVRVHAAKLLAEVAPVGALRLILAAFPGGLGTDDVGVVHGCIQQLAKRFVEADLQAQVASADPSKQQMFGEVIRKCFTRLGGAV